MTNMDGQRLMSRSILGTPDFHFEQADITWGIRTKSHLCRDNTVELATGTGEGQTAKTAIQCTMLEVNLPVMLSAAIILGVPLQTSAET